MGAVILKWTTALLMGLGFTLAACAAEDPNYGENAAAKAFVEQMVKKHGFDRDDLMDLMGSARKKESILKAMQRPAEKALEWHQYRKLFISNRRIQGGVTFWEENEKALREAEEKYGVPPEMVVAIIGIETGYGRNMGSYRVLDALSTLAFDYPRRSKFFSKELENFLLLTRDQEVDPREPKGSYAGAMGYGQFMPSSYRGYAIDFDGDGKADIWNNPTDAIGSVANYFKRHGWVRDGLVAVLAEKGPKADMSLVNKSLKLRWTVGELKKRGWITHAPVKDSAKANVFKLVGEDDIQYWFALQNFYTITRYNHSRRYAMAAYDLGQEIISARGGKD
ncbi:lytic murein transglycosylase B [Biformimicrobium ophioploci]|nr:lytic murein transglycosylase B [Microbulbifer sp. NKW57]